MILASITQCSCMATLQTQQAVESTSQPKVSAWSKVCYTLGAIQWEGEDKTKHMF